MCSMVTIDGTIGRASLIVTKPVEPFKGQQFPGSVSGLIISLGVRVSFHRTMPKTFMIGDPDEWV